MQVLYEGLPVTLYKRVAVKHSLVEGDIIDSQSQLNRLMRENESIRKEIYKLLRRVEKLGEL